MDPENGRYIERILDSKARHATNVLVCSIIGAAVGIVVDTFAGGLPRRESWSISVRMLLVAFIALAILLNGLRCFLQILTMPP
jgi:hypothetical protein